MEQSSPRLSIRGLMIAVVVAAGLFALPSIWLVLSLALASCCLAPLVAGWLSSRGHRGSPRPASGHRPSRPTPPTWPCASRRRAGSRSSSSGSGCSSSCRPPSHSGSAGQAWSSGKQHLRDAYHGEPGPWCLPCRFCRRQRPSRSGPLRLAFWGAEPALGRLADQVVAGRPIGYPRRVGPFRIVGSRVDAASGAVGLLIDPDPSGPTALVRNPSPRPGPFGCYRPIRGDVIDVRLGDGWCYHVED